MKRAVIIFAAGQGTRMKSPVPKVLHTIAHNCTNKLYRTKHNSTKLYKTLHEFPKL